jgi:uncharacterized protein YdaT
MSKNQHVVSEGERWAIKTEGSPQVSALFKTQSEAWERAKALARRERSEAILHGKNGLVRARSAYGCDPHRSKA